MCKDDMYTSLHTRLHKATAVEEEVASCADADPALTASNGASGAVGQSGHSKALVGMQCL